ncbi:MAG: superinfection immunity protein [Candidatus Electrothrix sp. MAN1_4]|nr:superinfection immunity protein [Candidatus Electrothrix sp. MAN1_4]
MFSETAVGRFLDTVLKVIVIAVIYSLPSIIAYKRNHHNALAIFLSNLFLGWTIIGWIVSIIWSGTAVKDKKESLED